jgi:hypothetical protein
MEEEEEAVGEMERKANDKGIVVDLDEAADENTDGDDEMEEEGAAEVPAVFYDCRKMKAKR